MRPVVLMTLAAAAAFALATPALADPPQLTSSAAASVIGGCCGTHQSNTSLTGPLVATAADFGPGGSFAHADVTTKFGEQHVSASAFLSATDFGPDVQTQAFSEYLENYAAGAFGSGPFNLTFSISGSVSAQPRFGPGSGAYLQWELEDFTHPATLTSGTWVFGTDASPVVIPLLVPVTDKTQLDVRFTAYAYTADPLNGILFADFSHTVHTYIDAVNGGPDVVGESGHDYASPSAVGGVPEPGAWALMLVGFAGLGAALRRRSAVAA